MTAGKRVAPAATQWAGCASVAQQAEDIRRSISVARVDEWVLQAQPTAKLLYGIGHSAVAAAADGVAARLCKLCEAGLVMLVAPVRSHPPGTLRDSEYGHDFLAIRTSLPVPPKFPQLPPPPVPPKRVMTAKVPPRKDQ